MDKEQSKHLLSEDEISLEKLAVYVALAEFSDAHDKKTWDADKLIDYIKNDPIRETEFKDYVKDIIKTIISIAKESKNGQRTVKASAQEPNPS